MSQFIYRAKYIYSSKIVSAANYISDYTEMALQVTPYPSQFLPLRMSVRLPLEVDMFVISGPLPVGEVD